MDIMIKHDTGRGANASYTIWVDGEPRGEIAMRTYGGAYRRWAIVDSYDFVLRDHKFKSKDDAIKIIKSGVIQLPTIQQAYEDACQRVYTSRKAQAIKYLATEMAKVLAQIAAGSNSAGDEAIILADKIERAARGETDLSYQYKVGTQTHTHTPIVGSFPQPPKTSKDAA